MDLSVAACGRSTSASQQPCCCFLVPWPAALGFAGDPWPRARSPPPFRRHHHQSFPPGGPLPPFASSGRDQCSTTCWHRLFSCYSAHSVTSKCSGSEPGGLQPSAPSFPSLACGRAPCRHSPSDSATGSASGAQPPAVSAASTGAFAAVGTGPAVPAPTGRESCRTPSWLGGSQQCCCTRSS